MAILYIGDSNNKPRKVKSFYIGDSSGKPRKVKRAYIGDSNNKPRLFYKSANVAYLNKKVTNVTYIIVNNSQGQGNISNTANSDAYIWVNSYRNNNMITTNAEEVYLYSDSSNFYQYFFNSSSQDIFRDQNITFDSIFKFDLVTNGYNFYQNGIYAHPILNLNNVNFNKLVNAANMFVSGDALIGSPPLMPNVTNMHRCYFECGIMSGTSIIGPKVTDASYAYYGCSHIIPNSQIPTSVVNMAYCYQGSISNYSLDLKYNSTKLKNIEYAFSGPKNIFFNEFHYYGTGGIRYAFSGRGNCYGNIYFHNLTSPFYNAAKYELNTFYNMNVSGLKVYVNKNFNLYCSESGRYNNWYLTSFLGISVSAGSWTNITNGVYNASYNIYVYNNL